MKSKFYIGKQIKTKRLKLNLRMDDVAKAVGITRSTLSSIENGTGNYTIDILLKLLSVLDISFNIEADDVKLRKRASRINSAQDKKINRFIVMCVEQYALFCNKKSSEVYKILKEKGILNELIEDYEDMHGMSTYLINEYIYKKLSGENHDFISRIRRDKIMSHILANTILISQTIELIAKEYKISIEEARDRFFNSQIIELLEDEETGLYGESALYLFSLYKSKKH